MKKILVVYTGGTICSFASGKCRSMDVSRAKRLIVEKFLEKEKRRSVFSADLFEDSKFEITTLSENMTTEKLLRLVRHIKGFDLNNYLGIIILHGTDTLGFTAPFMSFIFSDISIPVMLVSGHKPPDEKGTNANDNFRVAAELIYRGIAPNIYVPYKNKDGKMFLHLGSTLRQCPNLSDDFYNAKEENKFLLTRRSKKALKESIKLSENRKGITLDKELAADKSVLLITPYTGLNYDDISLSGANAVVHGTYHSGTVCVERNDEKGEVKTSSVLHLSRRCKTEGIPIFAAPSKLNEEQYSSVFDAVKNGGIIPLNMNVESAYAKALAGVLTGLFGESLIEFMKQEINNEILV